MPLLRRTLAAAVSVALVATTQVTLAVDAAAEPRSGCSTSGPTLRYVVLFDAGTAAEDAKLDTTVACGSLTGYYAQIAVGIAVSADPAFADRMGRDRAFSARSVTAGERGNPPLSSGGPVAPADRTGEQWNMTMIGADRERAVSADVLVGVLDSGIDATHPDLVAAVDPTVSAGCLTGVADPRPAAWAPTTSPHGTHVAGLIAAADDGRGITGVAPGVRLASVKVVDDAGYVYPEAVICGLMWAAAKRMTVTNNSYFVDPWLLTCDREAEHVVFEAVRRAVDYASIRGVLTVAAASNENTDLAAPSGETADSRGRRTLDGSCKLLPGGLRGVVAVSAVGPDQVKSGYSAYGLGVVDVTAPGGEEGDCVLSTVPGGYGTACGTSMAAPHVTGVAALLAGQQPYATPQRLARALTGQARSLPCPADYDLDGVAGQDAYCTGYARYNSFYGHGLVRVP
ncbi:S8 family peptidase [Actinokineospora fastidiosa]|uniref:Serine protease n=1 Tax=Actinokineospora fastidiosa TaxID=1816 RepID=A0A918GKT4_9PSEU|nr:S8 family serine peptidase [Actinokineospora fastidiosa]GGS41895.1 serine protease [Actinokineospora fastidiosa]